MNYKQRFFFSNSLLTNSIMVSFAVMPIIESLNGIYYGNHISDIYRLILLLLIGTYFVHISLTVKLNNQIFNATLVIYVFVFITCCQYVILHGQVSIFKSDFKTIFRILLCPLYYAFFYTALERGTLTRNSLKQLIYVYAILYAALVIVPYYMGKGYATYDLQKNSLWSSATNGVGVKGYFIETNSLVSILIACMLYVGEMLLICLKERFVTKSLYHVVLIGSIMFSLLFISTKTGILVALIYLIILILRILLCETIDKALRLNMCIIVLLFLPYFISSLSSSMSELFIRGKYFYQAFDGDIIRFLTSSRSTYLANTAEAASRGKHFIFSSMFGNGYYLNIVKPYELFKRTAIEMDGFDFYFAFGMIGIVSYFGYFRRSLIHFFLSKSSGMKLMLGSFIVYGLLAGHVLFNSMTATFLAICFAYFIEVDFEN